MGLVSTTPQASDSVATLAAEISGEGAPPTDRPWVGRYEIREVFGAGAMGVVYRAHDPVLGRAVAIKLVRSNRASADSHRRMLGEARALARVRHPNVIPIFDVGEADGSVFVAMPLVEGGTLRGWLAAPRSFDAIVDAFAAAGRGLAATHGAGLVHRDFKPDNVLLGAGGEIYVADFGLARPTGAPPPPGDPLPPGDPPPPPGGGSDEPTGKVVGTPAYMAPEQLSGAPIDARADQFSFCVALWEGLYGERPFADAASDTEQRRRARIAAIAAGPRPPQRSEHPAWIAPLLARGLAADPAQRWPSMQALLDAIVAHRQRRRRRAWLAAADRPIAAIGAIGAIGAVAVLATTLQPATPAPPWPLSPLVHLDDLRAAAISPDGKHFAFVTGDALVIEDRAAGKDRVVIAHGVEAPVAWSPDNRHLLVGAARALAPRFEVALVDADTGEQVRMPVHGIAGFLSSREAVIAEPRQRSLSFFDLATQTVTGRCDVAGDYTRLWYPTGLPDGRIAAEVSVGNAASHLLIALDRSCRVTALIDEPIREYAATDTGTLVALGERDGFAEILEVAPAGRVVSRRRTSSAVDHVLGRRAGIDYVTAASPRTELVRLHAGGVQRLKAIADDASIYPSPDGADLVWITHGDRADRPGRLWQSALSNPDRASFVLDRALTAGWSPSGQLLAVMIDTAGPGGAARPPAPLPSSAQLVVLDKRGAAIQRLAVRDLDRESAPVWLDEHRVAIRLTDRARYRWVDVVSLATGELGEPGYGSILWLAASPLDGELAMWRMGPPDAVDARTEHLWLQPAGGALRPLHIDAAVREFLQPSWTPSGELLIRSIEAGSVSRIALDTGAVTPLAQLPRSPMTRYLDEHLVTLPGGDLLAVNHEIGADVAMLRPGGAAPPP